jgi:hypothetical protein
MLTWRRSLSSLSEGPRALTSCPWRESHEREKKPRERLGGQVLSGQSEAHGRFDPQFAFDLVELDGAISAKKRSIGGARYSAKHWSPALLAFNSANTSRATAPRCSRRRANSAWKGSFRNEGTCPMCRADRRTDSRSKTRKPGGEELGTHMDALET